MQLKLITYTAMLSYPLQCHRINMLSKELNAVHLNLHALDRLACGLSILGIAGMFMLSL